jgi:hypothetical protein
MKCGFLGGERLGTTKKGIPEKTATIPAGVSQFGTRIHSPGVLNKLLST